MNEDNLALGERTTALRQELKAWEKQFATKNDGRKAGREDIRAHPHIAAKYKEFQRLQKNSGAKVAPPKSPRSARKRHSGDDVTQTPSKRTKVIDGTPRRRKESQGEVLLLQPEEHSTPVVKRTMIGPTPQKDGKLLGIFDLLPNETPSKLRTILGNVSTNVFRTPSKTDSPFKDDTLLEERARGSRTPASSGKRFLLESFVTPRKIKLGEEGTPSSSAKLLATPAFLRRDNFVLSTVEEEPQSPEMAQPWKRRSFGRSLSGMIKDLRKQEDDQADDEWEAMREMEEESAAASKPLIPKIAINDSQPRDIVLDAEGFVPSEGEELETETQPQLDRNGQPRKAWKKKGLKRQTKRVKMLPAFHKAPEAQIGAEQSESEEDGVRDVVEETQVHINVNDDSGSDYDQSGEEEGDIGETALKPLQARKKTSKAAEPKSVPPVAPRKSTKKVKPEAHANFVKLKIKNQNGKANKGRGRFGRNRR